MMGDGYSLGRYIWAHRKLVLGCILFGTLTVSINLALPFIIREMVDALVNGTFTREGLLRQVGWYGAGSLIAAAFSLGMRRLPLLLAHHIVYDLKQAVYEHLTGMDSTYFHAQRTGDIMTRMNADIRAVADMIGHGLMNITRASLAFTIGFIIMFGIETRLASIMAILLPAMTLIGFAFVMLIKKRYEEVQAQFSEISNYCQESFSGIRLVKSYGIEARQRSTFKGLNQKYFDMNMSLCKVEAPVWPLLGFLFVLGNLLILLVGGRLVILEEMSMGTLVQFQQYMLYLQWPTLSMGWALSLIMRGRASWGRVKKILDAQPDVRDGEQTNAVLQQVSGDIEYRQVSLEIGGTTLLDDLNFTIPQGMTIGVTGPTGSGKTLLAGLLTRQVDPTSGEVLVGGHDVRAFPLEVLRRDIRTAPQEPFLFSDTLASNISFGLEEPGEETMEWASEIAQMTRDAEDFPSGFETVLGERGVTLSGGQRQRTAIARAVASNPHILVLDDTLSAVDTHTEAEILSRLLPVLKERTSVLISHRVSTLKYAELIIVIENGRVSQMGRHEELTQQEGYYRELDLMQRLEAQLEAIR
ncbi:MAG: ATP-binding cassette subfamily B multidrug efflux pump [Kiritimatiellia bacterium]|jgi:ATP-binding cassette subfamily B multidrug efflux pump